jgi:RNA polymerase sigma-70 factor, ECF subfamily
VKSCLVARAQQGKEEAFAALFNRHKRWVYSLCLRTTGDPVKAEKTSEEVFTSLFSKISVFRSDSDFSMELYRLVLKMVLIRLHEKEIPIAAGDII